MVSLTLVARGLGLSPQEAAETGQPCCSQVTTLSALRDCMLSAEGTK